METHQNPIIQDNPSDTLSNVQAILTTLQEFYCAADLSQRSPDENVFCGLYWILRCTDNAIDYEIQRLKKVI